MADPTIPPSQPRADAVPAIARERLDISRPYVAPVDLVESRIAEAWEDTIGVFPVGVEDDFYELGGESAQGVEILLALEQDFGMRLPATALVDEPTVRHLAALVRAGGEAGAAHSLVPLARGSAGVPLFCFHDVSGSVLPYRLLARQLAPQRSVWGLEYRPMAAGTRPEIPVLAKRYVGEIREHWPDGPYSLLGYSLGASVAFEAAQLLRAGGAEVHIVALLDGGAPSFPPTGMAAAAAWCADLLRRPVASWPAYIRVRSGKHMVYHAHGIARWLGIRKGPPQWQPMRDQTEGFPPHADLVGVRRGYKPKPIAGRLDLFRCDGGSALWRLIPDMGWSPLAAGGLEIHNIPGRHGELMRAPVVDLVAKKIEELLATAEA